MTIEDITELERLAKVVRPNSNDIESIWNFYKIYINTNAPYPNTTGCSSCGNSVVKYWRELMSWWESSKGNFAI